MSFPSVTSPFCRHYITVCGEIYEFLPEEIKNKSSGLYKTTASNIDSNIDSNFNYFIISFNFSYFKYSKSYIVANFVRCNF